MSRETQTNSKNLGQYFTPYDVARFMCSLISKKSGAKILEPCAGKGVFLKVLENLGFHNVTAYEIDRMLNNESKTTIHPQNFLTVNRHNRYDVIVGNPPYVRWKNIPKGIQKELKNNEYWQEKMNGLSDLLYAFIQLSIDLLNDGGELIFITPVFWMETQHSKALRKYMSSNGELEYIIDFNEMPIFDRVSSNIIIFKYVKRKTGNPVKVVHLRSKKKLSNDILDEISTVLKKLEKKGDASGDFIDAYLHPQFSNGAPWKPIPPKIKPVLDAIEASCTNSHFFVRVKLADKEISVPLSRMLEDDDLEKFGIHKDLCVRVSFLDKKYYMVKQRSITANDDLAKRYIKLGDIAEIANGMVSGLDRAFKTDQKDTFEKNEKTKFIPVIKASALRQFSTGRPVQYIFANDVEHENELKENYPNIFHHLSHFKSDLGKRYDYGRPIKWWHWAFLRNKTLIEKSHEKILVPCKERIDTKGYIRFAYAEGEVYATQDVTSIVKKRYVKEDARYILALLNSKVILTWIKHKGLNRGGVTEFSEKPLSIIPIRLINWDDRNEVKVHDEIVKLATNIIETNEFDKNMPQIEEYVEMLYGVKNLTCKI